MKQSRFVPTLLRVATRACATLFLSHYLLAAPPPTEREILAARDAALQPATINFNPDDAHYGPDKRTMQGIAAIARAPGGRLWATWSGGPAEEGPDNYTMLSTSADDGRTWSGVRAVIDCPGLARAGGPNIWVDPQGKLWWFYTQSAFWWDGLAGVWAVTTDEPDKDHPRWSKPRRLFDGKMANKPTVLRNGDWLYPSAFWDLPLTIELPKKIMIAPNQYKYNWVSVPAELLNRKRPQPGAHVYVSHDRGATYQHLGMAVIPDSNFQEHMIVERNIVEHNDSRLWLLARTDALADASVPPTGHVGMAESFSSDGGHTWTRGQSSTIPHVNARFFIRRLNSGKLLLVKQNPPLDAGWLADPSVYNRLQKRSHLTAYLSADDGQTWSGGLLIDDRISVSYPDGIQAPDGRIFIAYDFNRKTDKEILLAVFTEEDVMAKKLVDPRSALRLLVNKATGKQP
jgi:hypothetical protein